MQRHWVAKYCTVSKRMADKNLLARRRQPGYGQEQPTETKRLCHDLWKSHRENKMYPCRNPSADSESRQYGNMWLNKHSAMYLIGKVPTAASDDHRKLNSNFSSSVPPYYVRNGTVALADGYVLLPIQKAEKRENFQNGTVLRKRPFRFVPKESDLQYWEWFERDFRLLKQRWNVVTTRHQAVLKEAEKIAVGVEKRFSGVGEEMERLARRFETKNYFEKALVKSADSEKLLLSSL